MTRCIAFLAVSLLLLTLNGHSWSAQSVTDDASALPEQEVVNANDSPLRATLTGSVIPPDSDRPSQSASYPLFRRHAPKYYPPKTKQTALLLSAILPGLGQTYAGQSTKGLAFLIADVGLIAVAGFNLDRAFHYDDLADRFDTGFFDAHGDGFLTPEQGRVKSRSHAQLGAVFLAGGVGVYIWNLLDAGRTVEQYNTRRFPVQVQQTVSRETYFTLNHHF